MKLEDFPTITFIFRNYSYHEVAVLAKLLSESENNYGVEIPLANEQSLNVISELKNNFPQLIIGAGTVLNFEQLQAVHQKGVQFVLSPIKMTTEMLTYCHQHQIISVPSAFSPTEINEMKNQQADIIKIFPINALGSSFLKDVQAPLGQLKMMAVGGVDSHNAKALLSNGASYLGIGSGVFNKTDITNHDYDALKDSLREFEMIIAS